MSINATQYRVWWTPLRTYKIIRTVWYNNKDDADRMAESIRAGGDNVVRIETKESK